MDNAVSQVEKGRAVLDPGILTSCWKGHDAGLFCKKSDKEEIFDCDYVMEYKIESHIELNNL